MSHATNTPLYLSEALRRDATGAQTAADARDSNPLPARRVALSARVRARAAPAPSDLELRDVWMSYEEFVTHVNESCHTALRFRSQPVRAQRPRHLILSCVMHGMRDEEFVTRVTSS